MSQLILAGGEPSGEPEPPTTRVVKSWFPGDGPVTAAVSRHMQPSLLQTLIPRLRERLPAHAFTVVSETLITYPARHQEVGGLEIHDDGDELTIFYGAITHAHFDDVEDVVAELTELFEDRIVLWAGPSGDGSHHITLEDKVTAGRKRFLWSGPLSDG